jgi:hypothetical protein
VLVMHNKKREMGYVPWQRQLDEHFTNLAICRREVPEADKKMYLLDLIVSDGRYRQEVNECADNLKLTYPDCVGRMKQRATRLNNLTGPTVKEGNNAEAKTTTETPEMNNTEVKGNWRGKNKGKGKGKRGTDGKKVGRGGNTDTNPKPKTGPDSDFKKRLQQEVCEKYLYGSCTYGEKCYRKHIDYKDGKPAQPKPKQNTKRDGKRREKTDECFDFRDYGECAHDPCSFKHTPNSLALKAKSDK